MKRNNKLDRTIKRRLATGLAAAWRDRRCFQLPATAEDIDLFVQPPRANSGMPNVLIVLDNTANWNTPFTNEKAALVETVNSLPVNDRRHARVPGRPDDVHGNRQGNSNVDGGYVRAAVRDLTERQQDRCT